MADLRLGLTIGYRGMDSTRIAAEATRAERLGFDSVWTGEAWGTDAVVPLVYAAAHTASIKLGTAIMQIPARTPAMTAMTAMTLDAMSGGRLILGIGASGPRVVEGWHGVPYGKPLVRTREYVTILRQAFAGQARLTHRGEHYCIPYDGPDATGLGKALRSSAPPRPDIPVYIAAIGPRNLRQATEIADGVLPVFMSPTNWRAAFGEALDGVDLTKFQVAPAVQLVTGDDIQVCRDKVRPLLGLYIGGMGAKGTNFYYDLVCRYGYEAAAVRIQDLYLGGHRRDAIGAVPDELIDELSLIGDARRVRDSLDSWRESPATTLILQPSRPEDLDVIVSIL
jgi:F420-dependent oxidoreductase-like protein